MAKFNVSVPHSIGKTAALERVQRFLDDVQKSYAGYISDVRGAWTENKLDFGFSATGMPIEGSMVVDDDAVNVHGPLPFAAMFFRGRIEQTIKEELEKLLS